MSDASNVRNGGMGRRVSEVHDLLLRMAIVPPSATTDFVGKLADEKEWPRERAECAYREYLRFLLMAWVSQDMVVPSHDVDQAWHLHLTHSRHYWDVLCGTILQRPFHHDPSLRGNDEDARHGKAYRRTLALYEHLFDEPAPMDAWPRGCTCDCECVQEGEVRILESTRSETVVASNPFLPIALFGISGCLIFLGMGYAGTAAFTLILTIAMAVIAAVAQRHDQKENQRPVPPSSFVPQASPDVRSTRGGHDLQRVHASKGISRPGSGSSTCRTSRSSVTDSSGLDAGLLFMSTYSPDADASHSPSSSHSSSCSTTSHSTHSCSSSSSSSCSSSSCGGSSCGGGGCGGS